jgi:hypothetical protein
VIVFGLIIVGFDASLASAVLLIFNLLPISLFVPLVAMPFLALLGGGLGSYIIIKRGGTRIHNPPKA